MELKIFQRPKNEEKMDKVKGVLGSSPAKVEWSSWMDKIPTCSLCKLKKKGERVGISVFSC